MDSFYIWHKWSLLLEGVSRVMFFSESGNLNFWPIFKIFRPWPWKNKSTVLDGFFPYLVQMITSMRRCVTCDDLWPWLISSRSFDRVMCQVYNKILKFKIFANFSAFTLKKNLQFCLHSVHILHKSSSASEGVLHVMTFDLDLYFQGHLALTLKIVSTL